MVAFYSLIATELESISLDEVLELARSFLFDYIFVISFVFSSVLFKSVEEIP